MSAAEIHAPHPRLDDAVGLLRRLVATPSLSRQEEATADIWQEWLSAQGVADLMRQHNNIFALTPHFSPDKPILLLNSHHDTVKPSPSYTRNPFEATVENGALYGLGSNDAGTSCVTLACTFLDLMIRSDLPVNLLLAITAEEEVMGEHGMRAFLPLLAERGIYPDMAIVGEPTEMQPAVAERGLLVIDAVAEGKSGHAAREEGINALYRAIDDIQSLRAFSPEKVSEVLGPIKVSITIINAGSQHNVVPDKCTYTLDVRTTDAYSNVETAQLLQQCAKWSVLTPRSARVQASVIGYGHPLVRSAVALGLTPFVSPTTSDRGVMHGLPALKIGPGKSSRSHTADEFVLLSEINEALHIYPQLIKGIDLTNG